jgi:subfamily B ATP-binding cassette protein MsbA
MSRYLRLLSYLKPYRLFAAGAFACGAAFALLSASYAWLMQPLLDDLFIRKDRAMLMLVPLAIIVVALFKGLASYGQNYLWQAIGLKVVRDIRESLYHHLVLLPIPSHSKASTGVLMSYVLNDVNLLQTAASTVFKNLVSQPLTLIALAGIIFYQNAILALLAIVVVPLFIVPLSKIGARLKDFAHAGQEKIGAVSAHLQETLSGIRVVKSFGKEHFESDRFAKKNRDYFHEILRATAIAEIAPPLMETMGAIGVALIIWYAGLQVINETMTTGQFFSFLTATMLMYGPLKILASANNTLQQAIAAAERVFAVLDEKNEEQLDEGLQKPSMIAGALSFQKVSFSYNNASSALLNIDLHVKSGTTIALVGHSGAGKSTLANLIPRFYQPTEGLILLDDVPINEIKLESLRSLIGMVSQEVILFDETVAWNIGYGKKDASMEEITRAAEAAYAHLFIGKMKEGYNTMIEKGGANLSGGERQRLAIARALLKNPPILILDEATSALDSESEFFVQKALSNLMKNRTTIVIAHRLSTVLNADCIVVMEQGRIIEMGRHAELIAQQGHYQKIYRMQWGNG